MRYVHESTSIQKKKSTRSETHQRKEKSLEHDIDIIAAELVDLANSRFPDGVANGALKGCEADIRQESILLALQWYLRQKTTTRGTSSWNAAQAICAALRYRKLDAAKRYAKEQRVRRAVSIQSKHEQNESSAEEWSPAEIRQIVETSIQGALKRGLISPLNASIAMQVYLDGVNVKELADCLNRTTGAIHQHLTRVRHAIPEIVHAMCD